VSTTTGVAPLSQAIDKYRSSLRRLKSLFSDIQMKIVSMLVATTAPRALFLPPLYAESV
jgi:hypothetical protein